MGNSVSSREFRENKHTFNYVSHVEYKKMVYRKLKKNFTKLGLHHMIIFYVKQLKSTQVNSTHS